MSSHLSPSVLAYADPWYCSCVADGEGESPSQLCGRRGYCDILTNLFLPGGSDTSNITSCVFCENNLCLCNTKKGLVSKEGEWDNSYTPINTWTWWAAACVGSIGPASWPDSIQCQQVVSTNLSWSLLHSLFFFPTFTLLIPICNVKLSFTPTVQSWSNGPCSSLSVTLWMLTVEWAL